MRYDYIETVYFNKEITERSLDDYDDRLGLFCVIQLKESNHSKIHIKRTYEMVTWIMKLMGYPGEISEERKMMGDYEVNHCWIRDSDDSRISIQHKYWNGSEMKVFCEIMESLGKFLQFEIEYLPAETLRKINYPR